MSAATPAPIFIGGCPRSGTSWLQLMLGKLDGVSTGPETHITDIYGKSLVDAYRSDAALAGPDGLAGIFGRDEYIDTIVVPAVRNMFDAHVARCGPCTHVVEKTPGNVHHPDLIDLAFPGSRFVEIVRDPRSVVASWKAVSRERWGGWARKSTFDVATFWNRAVLAGRTTEKRFGERHSLVRYEELLERPEPVCRRLTLRLGIDATTENIETACRDTSIAALKENEETVEALVGGRENFVRSGRTDSWKKELSAEDIDVVHSVCGDGMRRHGYAD